MKRITFILLFTCACIKMQAQVNIIKTICGSGLPTGGYCCDDSLAINAKLNYPQSLWLDKFNNIYIADALNQRVRKIDRTTNIITTIAGTGVPGYSGDNGLATNAQLFLPSAAIVDSNGNIYIADAENSVIRKVDGNTNIISTFAGNGIIGDMGENGPATAAELNGASGLCFDKQGNILIPDYRNNKIKKVDINTGIITTIAGNGMTGYFGDNGPATNAELNGPIQVFIDSSGNIFFTDYHNSRVRKIDISTGIIKTIAGNGTVGYFGDSGPATDAEFNVPMGLYIDQQQNIFIADDANGAVRRIDALTGIITTIAGTGVLGYSGDNGPANAAQVIPTDIFFDSYGAMFIADAGNNCIRKVFDPTGIKEQTNANTKISISPNPSTGRFTLQISPMEKTRYDIRICNAVGEKVFTATTSASSTEIDISDQPPGLYFLYLKSGDKQMVQKIAVSR